MNDKEGANTDGRYQEIQSSIVETYLSQKLKNTITKKSTLCYRSFNIDRVSKAYVVRGHPTRKQ